MPSEREQWYVVLTHAHMAPELIGPFVDEGLGWDHVEHITLEPGWSASVIEPKDKSLTTVTSSDLRPNALLPEDRANFDTLKQAMENDDVALLHARHIASGEHHALLCIMSDPQDGSGDTDVIPVARLIDGDPTEQYANPADDLNSED